MTTDQTSKHETDHDLLITLLANVETLQDSMVDVKNTIAEVKSMCSQRLPHCMSIFTTDKRLETLREEIDKKFDSRDQWAKWSLGLSITSFIGIIGMIVTLILKLH